MKPKIEDVAKRAGVSPTTVSRVMNNRGYISEKTRSLVYNAMEELNYVPNEMARSLLSKQSNIIGLIFPTVSNPFYAELIFHIELACEELGYKVFLCNSLKSAEKEANYLSMLLRNQVDGIIVGSHNRGVFERVNSSFPIVSMDQYISEEAVVVSSDNYLGGKLATEHLIHKGCQKIIHINGPYMLQTDTHLRLEAYQKTMENHGLESIFYEVPRSFDQELYKQIIHQIFSEHPDVDGIFASDDILAANVYFEALKTGRRVPETLKVVGYDGTETAQVFMPQLTTIRQPIQLMARQAVEILNKQINEQDYTGDLNPLLPVHLILGQTT
ncbi:LacI family DNA-binding transcriptional regulator [Paenibacillus terrae]